MHIIEKSSEQKTLCGWTKKMQRKFNNAHICAIPTYPDTKTLIFKEDFRAKGDFPIFVKDDPTIEAVDFTTPKRGYSGNYVFDLFATFIHCWILRWIIW